YSAARFAMTCPPLRWCCEDGSISSGPLRWVLAMLLWSGFSYARARCTMAGGGPSRRTAVLLEGPNGRRAARYVYQSHEGPPHGPDSEHFRFCSKAPVTPYRLILPSPG